MKTDEKEIKEMLRNYWFLDNKDQEKVIYYAFRGLKSFQFHPDYYRGDRE